MFPTKNFILLSNIIIQKRPRCLYLDLLFYLLLIAACAAASLAIGTL